MGLTKRISSRGKKMVLNPTVMRWLSDDRVMKAAEGVMGARTRVRAAWKILRDGHDLPAVDPSLDDFIGENVEASSRTNGHTNGHGTNGHTNGKNGHNGHAAANGHNGANGALKQNGHSNGNGHVTLTSGVTLADTVTLDQALRERTSLAGIGGKDVFEKCYQFLAADNARSMGMYPFFRPLDLNDGPEAVIDGRRVVMFGSNNYLGLTTHPKVREAAKAAIDRFGTSMTGSRLVNGSMKLHNEFEEKLAAFFGKESALVFTTGYQANLASCAALLSNKRTVAVIDRNVHASLYDGVRLGQAAGTRLVRYKHSDPESLDAALSRLDAGEGALVITDGVFSAEGEIARLDELVPVAKKHGARIFVDDAHALGVIGPGGRGSAARSRSRSRASGAGSSASGRCSTTSSTSLRASCSPRAPRRRTSLRRWRRST